MAICEFFAIHDYCAEAETCRDTCYKPIDFLTEEQRERKVEAFNRGYMTVKLYIQVEGFLLTYVQSHDPTDFVLKDGQMGDSNILFPYGRPTIDRATQQAIGIIPYD